MGSNRSESSKGDETIFMSLDVSPEPVPSRQSSDDAKSEVSAAAIARIMGVATSAEMRFVESKIELLNSKLTAIQLKMEKLVQGFNSMPSGADLERIDVQIGALRQLIRDVLAGQVGEENMPSEQKAKTKNSGKENKSE